MSRFEITLRFVFVYFFPPLHFRTRLTGKLVATSRQSILHRNSSPCRTSTPPPPHHHFPPPAAPPVHHFPPPPPPPHHQGNGGWRSLPSSLPPSHTPLLYDVLITGVLLVVWREACYHHHHHQISTVNKNKVNILFCLPFPSLIRKILEIISFCNI